MKERRMQLLSLPLFVFPLSSQSGPVFRLIESVDCLRKNGAGAYRVEVARLVDIHVLFLKPVNVFFIICTVQRWFLRERAAD